MIGFGFDVHRLALGETLVLGGVTITSEVGTVAHSDGDVLLHALADALLGSLALGDIGEHFPDTDPQWKGASSDVFVRRSAELIASKGFRIVNVDCTLVLEAPKILPYKSMMKENISKMIGIPPERVSIKATTNERMGYVGRGEGIQAYAVCEVQEA